ncbi:uncharacterized protein A1O9_00542 [Exophiala aquamarina CBS 119918]|uniref:Rhodopsin domain-containing protein n=1 Tax=Exophiala aquamarina CBS 119918 TaxID=1182545 RepID=A0A072PR19_9EURO|nr:uncharacterized protein A1O9_00542 [Exophiala aquamarina CBS 119918]KEF62569.1 hypothetical protein A1O9_00542 [Exophiala aquamarina CBS 119918]
MLQHRPCIHRNLFSRVIDDIGIPMLPTRAVARRRLKVSEPITSIVIDFATLILPIIMVCKLKTSRDKKIFVCILFGARISVPAITIPQLWKIQPLSISDDTTWDMVDFQTWNQVIMNVSLITACLPSLGRMMWELWAFGSGLRTTWCSRDAEGRDFGHELGLEKGKVQAKEKAESDDMVRVQVRRVRSFDSGTTIADRQKILPILPRRTTSRFRPVRKQDHHYRRPRSFSPVRSEANYLPTMQFAALNMPSPTTITQRCQNEEEKNRQSRFPFPPQAVLAARTSAAERPRLVNHPPPAATSHPPLSQSPTLPQISDSYYDEDASSIDIASYYLMNNTGPYDPNRTEIVLQTMIDELKSQNNSVYSCAHRIESSVYSAPRVESSVYSVRTRNDGGWI